MRTLLRLKDYRGYNSRCGIPATCRRHFAHTGQPIPRDMPLAHAESMFADTPENRAIFCANGVEFETFEDRPHLAACEPDLR